MVSLRERNRRLTMEHIQDVAFGLFEKKGYRDVTITEIARAAEVAPSTFYRLFQTKEGLFTALPTDGRLDLEAVRCGHVAEGVLALVAGNDWRGLKWVIEEPDVRCAVLATLDHLSSQVVSALVAQGDDPLRASVEVRSLVFGVYLTSLEQWHAEGRREPFESYFAQARESGRLRDPAERL